MMIQHTIAYGEVNQKPPLFLRSLQQHKEDMLPFKQAD